MSYEKPEDFAELTRYINWPLLQRQKHELLRLAGTAGALSFEQKDALSGVVNLLDALQDLAVDSGLVEEEVVFGKQENDDD